jgi:hypothetical protein
MSLLESLGKKKSNSLKEFKCETLHFLEPDERIKFVNELWRVLKPNAKATITIPHWLSNSYYSDLRVKWPPVTEGWFWNLNRGWREENKISSEYTCNFHVVPAFGVNPAVSIRSKEFTEFALQYYKEAATSLIMTLTKEL